jgi:hypothetical protein
MSEDRLLISLILRRDFAKAARNEGESALKPLSEAIAAHGGKFYTGEAWYREQAAEAKAHRAQPHVPTMEKFLSWLAERDFNRTAKDYHKHGLREAFVSISRNQASEVLTALANDPAITERVSDVSFRTGKLDLREFVP